MSATVQEFSDLFIGGEWLPASSDGMLDVISPASGEVIARVPEPTNADADAAVAAARKAFDEGPWPRMSPAQRAEYISALRDQFSERLDEFNAAWTAESGPTLAHGAGLHGAVLNVYEDLIARAQTLELSERRELPDGTTVEVIRDPVGVALDDHHLERTWSVRGDEDRSRAAGRVHGDRQVGHRVAPDQPAPG